MKNLFKIDLFTYLLLILSFFSGYFREIIIVYIILFVHEFGHFFLMKYFGIEVKSITMYPYGGMIKSNMLINTNSKKVLLISFGGIISQLLLGVIVYLFFYKCYFYDIFCRYNISLIIFNLLPIYPLDGFKILNSILEMFINFKCSIVVSLVVNLVSLILFFYYMYINRVSNYIIILFMLFSFIKYIKEIKYIINKFYLERCIYDFKFDGLVGVKKKEYMYKNKFNYIGCKSEKEFLSNNL